MLGNGARTATATPLQAGSAEEFITEHYWGYTFVSNRCTGVYQVAHPRWNIHEVKSHDIKCSTARLYGKSFEAALNQPPCSVFLADGSAIQVYTGSRLLKEE